MKISRQELAEQLGVTYTAILYLVRRGHLREDEARRIDLDDPLTVALRSRYAKGMKGRWKMM